MKDLILDFIDHRSPVCFGHGYGKRRRGVQRRIPVVGHANGNLVVKWPFGFVRGPREPARLGVDNRFRRCPRVEAERQQVVRLVVVGSHHGEFHRLPFVDRNVVDSLHCWRLVHFINSNAESLRVGEIVGAVVRNADCNLMHAGSLGLVRSPGEFARLDVDCRPGRRPRIKTEKQFGARIGRMSGAKQKRQQLALVDRLIVDRVHHVGLDRDREGLAIVRGGRAVVGHSDGHVVVASVDIRAGSPSKLSARGVDPSTLRSAGVQTEGERVGRMIRVRGSHRER